MARHLQWPTWSIWQDSPIFGGRNPIGQSSAEILDALSRVKRAIAAALSAAETGPLLSVQPEFDDIFDTLVCQGSERVYLITTNWEGTAERAARRKLPGIDALYLHGRASEADRLYLPSEIVEEPYRTEPERQYLSNARAHAARAMGSATRLVIYGLAVSALDAELGALLFAAVHQSTVKEVHVVDPCHRDVVERLLTLEPLGTSELPIYSRSPSALQTIQRFPSA